MKGALRRIIRMKPYWSSSSAFLWITVLLILLCQLSSEPVNARVLIARARTSDDEGKAKAMLEKPGFNNSPAGAQIDDEDLQNMDAIALQKIDLDNSPYGSLRDKRATNQRKSFDDPKGLKHVQRIPISSGRPPKRPPAPSESASEETAESLESNREAFLEILNDNARHPHRKPHVRKHNSNQHLRFNEKTQRWSLTEEQSDEWFI